MKQYIAVISSVFAMLLALTREMLFLIIYKTEVEKVIWMGVEFSVYLIFDLVLYLMYLCLFIVIISVIPKKMPVDDIKVKMMFGNDAFSYSGSKNGFDEMFTKFINRCNDIQEKMGHMADSLKAIAHIFGASPEDEH